MVEYIVKMGARVRGSITVEADGLGSALRVAEAQGMELSDIIEILDSEPKSAEYFQG